MLETFSFRTIAEYLPQFARGMLATAWMSGLAFALAVLLGIVLCAMVLSRRRILRVPARIYIDVIRATPLLVQLYFLYFGLPRLGIRLPEIVIGIVALALNSGAYVAEILRAGIQAVPRGQIEAAIAFGLRYILRMRLIVLPQALRATVPPLLGQAIVLVKDSALLSIISVMELMRVGQQMASERFMPAEGYLTSAVCYLLLYYALKGLSALYLRGGAKYGGARA